jgi:hypothetical protein
LAGKAQANYLSVTIGIYIQRFVFFCGAGRRVLVGRSGFYRVGTFN